MLREMYEQFAYGEATEVERVTPGSSPFVKFAFKSPSCIMIAEFSEVSGTSLQSIDARLMIGETELLSLTFIQLKIQSSPHYAEKYNTRLTYSNY